MAQVQALNENRRNKGGQQNAREPSSDSIHYDIPSPAAAVDAPTKTSGTAQGLPFTPTSSPAEDLLLFALSSPHLPDGD